MTEISFYQVTVPPYDKAVPRLLEKVIANQLKAILLVSDEEKIRYYNELLWTYSSRAFLPHGSKSDPSPELQPIYVTDHIENPNRATVLFSLTGTVLETINAFDKVIDMFNVHEVDAARERYKHYKKQGYSLVYWFQNASGSWEKKEAA